MNKKIGWVILVFGLCLMLPGCILLSKVPDGYQYVVPAGQLEETYSQAMKAVEGLEKVIKSSTISARKQGIHLSGQQKEVSITLYGVDAIYPTFCHETLRTGRYVSAGDIEKKRSVIVIDEDTAYALFTGGDAIGKTLTIEGIDWEIVGIVAESSRFGESDTGVAYIPITTAMQLQMDTLEIRTDGTDQAVLVETALKQWRSDGTFHDLAKEKYAASMPLRWIVTCAVWMLTIWLLKKAVGFFKAILDDSKLRLNDRYLQDILPWIAGRWALLILLGMAAIASAIGAMKLLTAPALIFTDWIPENPVSITAYVNRFWKIHHGNAKAIQYITHEKSIVTLAVWLIRWGTISGLGGCLIATNKRRNTK